MDKYKQYMNNPDYEFVHYSQDGEVPNSQIESEENSVTPNGQFTQYNASTHEQQKNQVNPDGNVNLEQGEMVFSDRLKSGKKTFADLNKVNNTNKEDKMLENGKSNSLQKLTAQLMKEAKMKQSMKLFQEQESLKQSKMQSYAKRIGMSGDMFPNGGKKGASNYNPANYQSSFDRFDQKGPSAFDIPSYNKLGDVETAANLKNLGAVPHSGGINGLYSFQGHVLGPHPNGSGSYVNLGYENDPKFNINKQPQPIPQLSPSGQLQPLQQPTQVAPMNIGQRQSLNFNSPYGVVNPNNNTVTNIDPNASASQSIQPNVKQYGNGGLKRYPNGGYPDTSQEDNASYSNPNNTNFNSVGFTGAPSQVSNNQSQGSNWGNIGKQVALGLGNNVGNIYDLARGNKTEVQKYDRANIAQVNPNAELGYNDQVFAGAKEDVKNASVGNSSTYIQNRKDLAINQMMTNARIKSQYDNQNAGMQNQGNEFNANISMQEQNANAMNRAAGRNLTSNALSNIGQNVMGQYADSNMHHRDQDMLGMIQGQYPQGMNNPALADYYRRNGRNNGQYNKGY